MDTLGFIGLGVMGMGMAKNLAAKYPGLLVFDIDGKKTEMLVNEIPQKVKKTVSIAELAGKANIVFLSLPATAVVRTVISGTEGIASQLKEGSIVVDTSTTEPAAVKELALELKRKNINFIDAPVSGGEKGAREGTLSFMAGADEKAFSSVKDYLYAMGTSVIRMGITGTGQAAKAVNQMIVGAAFAVIAESFILGVKNGLDPAVLYEAVKGGWAGSKVLDVAVGDMLSGEYKPGGSVDIQWKDLGYALELARDTDVPTPVTALVHEIFKASKAAGDGKKSQSAIIQLWERLYNR